MEWIKLPDNEDSLVEIVCSWVFAIGAIGTCLGAHFLCAQLCVIHCYQAPTPNAK